MTRYTIDGKHSLTPNAPIPVASHHIRKPRWSLQVKQKRGDHPQIWSQDMELRLPKGGVEKCKAREDGDPDPDANQNQGKNEHEVTQY
jgi:hypothetical protein